MKTNEQNSKMIIYTGIVVISGFLLLSALSIMRALAPDAAIAPPAAATARTESTHAGSAPAMARLTRQPTHAPGPAMEQTEKPPVRTVDALDAESVMLRRQLQRDQIEEFRKHSRENPDAPDALSEEQLAEMEQKELIVH